MDANPYAATEVVDDAPEAGRIVRDPWRVIAARWEWLRIPYNLIMMAAGIPFALFLTPRMGLGVWAGAVAFGLGANVMYLLGPIGQMYLQWFSDLLPSGAPAALVRLSQSKYLTGVLWCVGMMFSLVVLLAASFSASLPNQQ